MADKLSGDKSTIDSNFDEKVKKNHDKTNSFSIDSLLSSTNSNEKNCTKDDKGFYDNVNIVDNNVQCFGLPFGKNTFKSHQLMEDCRRESEVGSTSDEIYQKNFLEGI